MHPPHHLFSTKLQPPRLKNQCLRRERLDQLFRQVVDYPVTLVQAEAGYGKSTALVSHLCTQFDHIIWYTVEKGERDLSLFVQYLIHALKTVDSRIGERSLRLLEESESPAAVLQPCMTLLINDLAESAPDPTILVLDDFHSVWAVKEIETAIDLLIRYLPTHVHMVIGSRKILESSVIKRLQTVFDLLFIGKKELSFTMDEIGQLFESAYGIRLETEQAKDLLEQTEGWIIALQMVWKGLEKGLALPNLWREQPETGRQLFDYLAEEVFDRQTEEIKQFLQRTCILESLEPEICDRLLDSDHSSVTLAQLEKEGLFVEGLGSGQYRYHKLFQRFLLNHAKASTDRKKWLSLHREAASYYQKKGNLHRALFHLYEAGSLSEAVDLLLASGQQQLASGRLELLKVWIDKLPSTVLEQYPQLLLWRGEIDRISSRFAQAEHWYTLGEGAFIQKADALGRSQVYRGQAQMYLDTIQPSKAINWLKKAVEVLGDKHPEERAKLLRLLAENHTNSGLLREAKEMVTMADQLAPRMEPDELDIRIHLRTGNLTAAKQITQEMISKEQTAEGTVRVPRFHREMHLLMSLVNAFRGDMDASKWHAEQGIRIGRELQSPFVEMVGCMRMGHAFGMAERFAEAQEYYFRSIRMSDELGYERGKVEAYMGLCATAGLTGELEQAKQYAQTGLELALNVQDRWCANLIRLSFGSTQTIWGQYEEALPWLLAAEEGFRECGDEYCLAKVRMWLSILYNNIGNHEGFARVTSLLLHAVHENDYLFLFQKRTLFGPSDLQAAVPCLIRARDELKLATADKILKSMGCKGIQKHPGYTLRIYTLGKFSVYRGMEEVGRREWKREKSRQLFQLFVTRPGEFLQRDEIYELLWPDADDNTATRDFKVAMNALTNAIEPDREARSDSFFIERIQTAYRLNPEIAVWIDAAEFQSRAEKGLLAADKESGPGMKAAGTDQVIELLESALVLYKGDYFKDYPYQDWCANERDRLRTLYLRGLEKLARIYQTRGLLHEAIGCCERMLASDSCWEAAYQILIGCYHQQGNRSLLIATYKKCVAQLEEHLGLAPSAEINQLYQKLVRGV